MQQDASGYLIVDLETMGLDAANDDIYEMAWTLTNHKLQAVASYHRFLVAEVPRELDDFQRNSTALRKWRDSKDRAPLAAALGYLTETMHTHSIPQVFVVGCNPSFDRDFLIHALKRCHMSQKHIHHRTVDLETIVWFIERLKGTTFDMVPGAADVRTWLNEDYRRRLGSLNLTSHEAMYDKTIALLALSQALTIEI